MLDGLLDKAVRQRAAGAWYGSDVDLRVSRVDPDQRRVRYSYSVTGRELSCGCLDSGWLATVVDNATDPLACFVAGSTNTLSTSLSVHTLEPVLVDTLLEIECLVVAHRDRCVQATATFRDARVPHVIYATGAHTMVYRDAPPRL
ncbi:hypothetical protein IWW55_006554 [Coemansia sp. RSA 2706]|nr:hypothetical protein LPJ63_003793 [Coemansia sp. RSA 2711]KAJ2288213.1 hypothetical protein IWW55_006554 [Coemansia sp. RSA 2706]KAJ2304417.1 hypothetical protein IWW54_005408 [Coemansia sp. RSA 2705]KAJ2311388.1 hypothetical protein IWW52_005150 [Coemansia sp. RSA 2704]KAJ2319503.1 hypothetical protein IWW51_004851 [Coemansia sp. RSA 2702]KAJ2361425.1 hypothetical protein H4S01_005269 [Coemansia sp. RSA 2610]KAJ2718291.1 hypothetical protein H4R23_005052 [Coemansia sp. Cherry 401B]